jgi:hypothetical protein
MLKQKSTGLHPERVAKLKTSLRYLSHLSNLGPITLHRTFLYLHATCVSPSPKQTVYLTATETFKSDEKFVYSRHTCYTLHKKINHGRTDKNCFQKTELKSKRRETAIHRLLTNLNISKYNRHWRVCYELVQTSHGISFLSFDNHKQAILLCRGRLRINHSPFSLEKLHP